MGGYMEDLRKAVDTCLVDVKLPRKENIPNVYQEPKPLE